MPQFQVVSLLIGDELAGRLEKIDKAEIDREER